MEISPIVSKIAQHSASRACHGPIILGAHRFSYSELIQEILNRRPVLQHKNPNELSVEGQAVMPQSLIDALARLASGAPIAGATSGSTGNPKRYHRTQESWVKSFIAEQDLFGICQSDIVLAHGNLSHSLFLYAACNALYRGAGLSLSLAFRPAYTLNQAAQLKATVIYGVPTQLQMIAARPDRWQIPSVRLVLSSGARFSAKHLSVLTRVFPNAQFYDFYGASETSYVAVANHTADPDLPTASVGKLFPGVRLQIDSERSDFSGSIKTHPPKPTIGRLWVHSDQLFTGYLENSPAVYQERVDSLGRRWISVGDLGWQDVHGYLFLCGRADRVINVAGVKIQPEEIEEALRLHPAVAQAAVLGLPDGLRGERLVAAYSSEKLLAPLDLIAHLRKQIPEGKVPRTYVSIDQWPLNASGKTDFLALKTMLQSAPLLRS